MRADFISWPIFSLASSLDRARDAALDRWSRIARNQWLGGLLAASFPLLAGTAVAWIKGPFHPLIHDEYSHALAADTFANGRLTNPPHPFRAHFENFDLVSRPTRMSRKPPAIGLSLALGQVLTGDPIAGALLTVASAAAAIYWALLAWLPPAWALLGGCLAGTHPALFAWSVSYWGGGVGVLGGALALGAWRRLMDRPRPSASAVLGVGLALLANSRPFEGLVFAAPLGLTLAWRCFAESPRGRKGLIAAFGPLAGVLLATLAAMGYYNLRVTGDATSMPYTVYEEEYSSTPLFVWQKPKTVRAHRSAEFDALFNRWNFDQIRGHDTPSGYLAMLFSKLRTLAGAWLAPWPIALLFAAGALGLAAAQQRLQMALFLLGIIALTHGTVLAHYSSPAAPLFFLIVLSSMRRLSGLRWRGRAIGETALAASLALCAANSCRAYADYPSGSLNPCARIKDDFRARVDAAFGAASKHLVFVRYPPDDFTRQGWIYNPAEMESAKTIWARDLSPRENCALEAYYKDRNAWLLEVRADKAAFTFLRPAGMSATRPACAH